MKNAPMRRYAPVIWTSLSCLIMASESVATDEPLYGLRARQILSEERGNRATKPDLEAQELKNDLQYVKTKFVDDPRYYQGWQRTSLQVFRAVDYVPVVGALGLGRDFLEWQTDQMDHELAAWANYGLEKLRAQGKLTNATPQALADILLGPNSPFKNDPQVVREAVSGFVVRVNAASLSALQADLSRHLATRTRDRQLTAANLRQLQLAAEASRTKQEALEKEVAAIRRRSAPTTEEHALAVLRSVETNAQAVAGLFPNDSGIQHAAVFAARGAQFAQLAVLAAGPGGAAFVLPAVASGMALLKGGGRRRGGRCCSARSAKAT